MTVSYFISGRWFCVLWNKVVLISCSANCVAELLLSFWKLKSDVQTLISVYLTDVCIHVNMSTLLVSASRSFKIKYRFKAAMNQGDPKKANHQLFGFLKCEDLLCFFGFCAVGWTKEATWRNCHELFVQIYKDVTINPLIMTIKNKLIASIDRHLLDIRPWQHVVPRSWSHTVHVFFYVCNMCRKWAK